MYNICAQQAPAAMYSASAVDKATLFCFLEDQDTSDLPKANAWCVLKIPKDSFNGNQMSFLRISLNLAHIHTLNMMSGLDAVKYNKVPIIER